MDDGGEGVSWIGNIVQKFEDLFSGVDVVMSQELTSVMTQLHTVGANVVKFCWDLVEDESPQSSDNKVKEPASDIDVVDSDASMISIAEDHCKNESCNENQMLCSSSVEPTESFQFVASGEQNVDSKIYEKSEVIGKENLVKDKQFHYGISVEVSPKGEESNNLEEDKQFQHETSLRVSLKENRQLQRGMSEGESYNLEDASIYISSPILSSYSVSSNADASTESSEDIPDIDMEDADTDQSFDNVKFDESILKEDDSEFKKFVAMSRRQDAHISSLRWEEPHLALRSLIMQSIDRTKQKGKTISKTMQALHRVTQDQEKFRALLITQEHESCDSEWVIV